MWEVLGWTALVLLGMLLLWVVVHVVSSAATYASLRARDRYQREKNDNGKTVRANAKSKES